jgi:hypothetical protein
MMELAYFTNIPLKKSVVFPPVKRQRIAHRTTVNYCEEIKIEKLPLKNYGLKSLKFSRSCPKRTLKLLWKKVSFVKGPRLRN